MSDFATAIFDQSPNFGYPPKTHGRNGEAIVAIVDHIESGTEGATDSWFDTPSSMVSAHYSVSKKGTVRQHVLEADAAWGNGIDFSLGYDAYKSDLTQPWIADCWKRKVSPNLKSISIEHEGMSGDVMPDDQYEASLALKRDIIARHELPFVKTTLAGHFQIDAVTRSGCPGPTHPWDRFYLDLGMEEELTAEQKKEALDHLAVIWGFSDAKVIASNPTESQNAIRERIVALKIVLGING